MERFLVWGPDRLAYARGLTSRLRQKIQEFDIVHIHSIFTYPVHMALQIAQKAGVPTILRPCGLLHRYSLQHSRWQKRFYLSQWGSMVQGACTAWHYTSANEAAESWPFDCSPRFILGNGIEPREFDWDLQGALSHARGQVRELGDSPYVLFLGRLHPKKRLDLLLKAFLEGAPSHFKLLIAGHDECCLWPRLVASMQGDQSRRVVFLGPVSGRLKTALLAGASLFALPSEHENFGVAALEALASGTPALLSPHVDLAAEIAAAEIGVICDIDQSLWKEQIGTLLMDELRLRAMGQKAKRWVTDRYQWSTVSATLLDQYRKAIGRHNVNGRR